MEEELHVFYNDKIKSPDKNNEIDVELDILNTSLKSFQIKTKMDQALI